MGTEKILIYYNITTEKQYEWVCGEKKSVGTIMQVVAVEVKLPWN